MRRDWPGWDAGCADDGALSSSGCWPWSGRSVVHSSRSDPLLSHCRCQTIVANGEALTIQWAPSPRQPLGASPTSFKHALSSGHEPERRAVLAALCGGRGRARSISVSSSPTQAIARRPASDRRAPTRRPQLSPRSGCLASSDVRGLPSQQMQPRRLSCRISYIVKKTFKALIFQTENCARPFNAVARL